jgi:DNA-binding CsgD family transcriptional regulator
MIQQCPSLKLVLAAGTWEHFAQFDDPVQTVLTSVEHFRSCEPALARRLSAARPGTQLVCMGPHAKIEPPKGWQITLLHDSVDPRTFYRACGGHDCPLDRVHEPGPMLSRREVEAMMAAGQGVSLKEAAARSGVSIGSIQSYRRRAMQKLGIANEAELVKYAAAFGLCACPCGRKKTP